VACGSCGRNGPFTAGFPSPVLRCSPYLTIMIVHCGQRSVLRLYGELDVTNKDCLRRAISSAMEKHHPQTLIVDLSALGFVDCGSLAVLVWAHVRLAEQGLQLVITGGQPIVRRLLSLTGLDTYLHLGGTEVSDAGLG